MTRVLAAMSGGVDSAVAALLLQTQGYDVSGATMRLFCESDVLLPQDGTCGSLSDCADAAAVCRRLGIPHHVFAFQDDFRREVIERFGAAYARGETPNPCIDCNRFLKFRRFLQEADAMGFDRIATGHYARIERAPSGRYLLKKATDSTKDQSYVLYSLSQEVLARTVLPLGALSKADIREIAREHNFTNAHKPDSQDICFVPDGDYASFLENKLSVSLPVGEFVRKDNGRVVGQHRGLHRYTIGQRKGLGIAAEKPLYVVQKDRNTNRVILGDNADLFCNTLQATDCNWIAVDDLRTPLRVTAKTRYSQAETAATVYPLENGDVKVCFEIPQRAVTAGQAVVFYDGELVVGGGTILSGGDTL